MPSRRLDWPDCRNTRDLGGLPLAGGLTRTGMLIRSDNLRSLTAAGQAAMVAYGVTDVIDLRSESEVASSPSPFAAAAPFDGLAPTYRHMPLVDDATMRKLAEAPDMFDRYLMMLEHRPDAFRQIFTALARTEGAAVFHCFAGKDRTGMVAAMSLALAGVDVDSIAADYAETDAQMATRYEEWLAAAPPDQLVEMREDLRCPPERIVAVLEHLDERWGGAEGYLETAGVPSTELATLRSKLQT
ncbi:MAG TPA: tyrosine-protein phosphatase [Candidatus Dormibacteraeota bacterium]|nr:tyrosine-protein phosphatase [Candidatus Dormibacteraeota bacterium]